MLAAIVPNHGLDLEEDIDTRGNIRAHSVHLVEGRVGSPDIVLGPSCGPMQQAKAKPIRESTRHWLYSFTISLK